MVIVTVRENPHLRRTFAWFVQDDFVKIEGFMDYGLNTRISRDVNKNEKETERIHS